MRLENFESFRSGCLLCAQLGISLMGVSAQLSFTPQSNWTWMSGGNVPNARGIYDSLGNASAAKMPGGRSNHGFVVDSNTGIIYLFGGVGRDASGTPTKYWTWLSGSTATGSAGVYSTTPGSNTNPQARNGIGMSFDHARRLVYIFGGYQGSCVLNDLWSWDPATRFWTWLSGSSTGWSGASCITSNYGTRFVPAPTNYPGGRQSCSMVVIPSSGQLMVFGGSSGGNELWSWDPSSKYWTWLGSGAGSYGQIGVPLSTNWPSSRDSASMAVDTKTDVVFLFGGYEPRNDLWSWSNSTLMWTLLSGTNQKNIPSVFGTMGVAAATNQIGGRYGAVMEVNPFTGSIIIFGGRINSGWYNELWQFDPTIGYWTWLGGGKAASYGTMGVPDSTNIPSARGEFCGSINIFSGDFFIFGGNLNNDLWRLQPSTRSCGTGLTLVGDSCIDKVCPIGSVLDTKTFECIQCGNTTYQNGTVCANCPVNATCSSTAFLCPPNFQYEPKTHSCVPCMANLYTWNPTNEAKACVACPLAANCSSTGITCIPGFAFNSTARSCVPCKLDTFKLTFDNTPCLRCPLNGNCTATSVRCLPGYSFNSSAATLNSSCPICPVGSYCDGSSTIYQCPGNSSTRIPGMQSISGCICNPGFYGANGQCTICQMGNYCPGGEVMLPCINANTTRPGAMGPEQCVCNARYFGSNNTCRLCPLGEYCSGGSSRVQCGTNSNTTLSGSQSVSQCVCNPGYFGSDGMCTLCPFGNYCPGGLSSYSCGNGNTAQQGSVDVMQCNCSPGFAVLNGTCTSCPIGSYCPGGKAAIPCGDTSTTQTLGSTSTAQCVCKPGFYGFNANCAVCPRGSFCTGGTHIEACIETSNTLATQSSTPMHCICVPGFFGQNNTCEICPVGSYCPGGQHPTNCVNANTTVLGSTSIDQCICNPGYFGVGRVCDVCPRGCYCSGGTKIRACGANSDTLSTAATDPSQCVCNPGYSGIGNVCEICPIGFYCTGGNVTVPCGGGTTENLGSSTSSQCRCTEGLQMYQGTCQRCTVENGCINNLNNNNALSVIFSNGLWAALFASALTAILIFACAGVLILYQKYRGKTFGFVRKDQESVLFSTTMTSSTSNTSDSSVISSISRRSSQSYMTHVTGMSAIQQQQRGISEGYQIGVVPDRPSPLAIGTVGRSRLPSLSNTQQGNPEAASRVTVRRPTRSISVTQRPFIASHGINTVRMSQVESPAQDGTQITANLEASSSGKSGQS